MKINTEPEFGMIDTKTGVTARGYIKDGEMKFEKIPWYKKLFAKEPSKVEYLGVVSIAWRSSPSETIERCLYRKFNPFTNETQCLYVNLEYEAIYFDVNAYEKDGLLIKSE